MATQPFEPMVLSKRSWDLAFGSSDLPMLTWREEVPVRPMARALFFEDVADIQPPRTAAPPKARRTRKTLAPPPIVETSVRRCTRSSAQRDGFKPTFQELSLQPKRRKPRAKPFTAEVPDDLAQEEIPPATPVARLQEIGRELEIDAQLLTVDALMVDPPHAAATNANE